MTEAFGEFLDWFEIWLDARKAKDECMDRVQFDAGYWCADECDAERAAREHLETAFVSAVASLK